MDHGTPATIIGVQDSKNVKLSSLKLKFFIKCVQYNMFNISYTLLGYFSQHNVFLTFVPRHFNDIDDVEATT